MAKDVVVVVGIGGMGEAIAIQQGSGRQLLLSDFNEESLARVAGTLRAEGHSVATQKIDVSNRESVAALAAKAAELGPVKQVIHTAGLSPVQASTEAVLAVDLVGTALVLEEFGKIIATGGAGVFISSMAGFMGTTMTQEQESIIARTPADELLKLDFVAAIDSSAMAYSFSKRANHLQVVGASITWGKRGARVNSISPGVISTKMGQEELDGPSGAQMRAMIAASGTGRVGTPADIATAAAFLLGDTATFITGTDLLVDGGVVAALKSGALGG